jgi:glycosyltransferase involved in cell wall biosynthesis
VRRERIKLLTFVDGFGVGGTERHVMAMGKGLDPSRFDMHLACFKRWGHFLPEVEAWGCPITEYTIHRLYAPATIRQVLRLARQVRRRGFDIVHAYNFYANVFAVPGARLAGAPVVLASIRDTGVYLTPAKKRVLRAVCRLADRVLVNAEAIRSWLVAEGYDSGKIVVIRNGIDLGRFTGRKGGARIRGELGIPAGAPLVAVLSRLDQLKGHEYFLEAAAEVARRVPDARFLVIGDRMTVRAGEVVSEHTYRAGLEEYARRLGLENRVAFTGFRLDVPELLSEIAVSVLPTLSEGLSNTILESMAAGVPVVATAVGGNPEAVEHGVTGLLVPPRDARELAGAIASLLENPDLARTLGEAARRRVAERFSLDLMVRQTERLYQMLLEGTSRGRRRAAVPPGSAEAM